LQPSSAAIVALIFAFGTSAWSTASRSLWQHGPSMLMLAAALLIQRRGRRLALAGACLAFAYVIRPTNAIPLAAATIWTMGCRRDSARSYLAVVAATIALFGLSSRIVYGSWLPPYYAAGRLGGNPAFFEALARHLVSPGRGLLVFSPVLVFAGLGVALKIRLRRFTALDASLVAVVLLHWIAISSFPHWWGGHSYGPRFFSDMLPYLVYF